MIINSPIYVKWIIFFNYIIKMKKKGHAFLKDFSHNKEIEMEIVILIVL